MERERETVAGRATSLLPLARCIISFGEQLRKTSRSDPTRRQLWLKIASRGGN